MSVLIKGMEMPTSCDDCRLNNGISCYAVPEYTEDGVVGRTEDRPDRCPLVPVPPHGDLIDRDALIKDGWSNLHKEVMRMGGYAIHELPLKNPSIPVIIPAEEGET